MTPALNSQLHALLNQSGLKEQKGNLVLGFTGGRTESSKDMTNREAIDMIKYLKEATFNNDSSQKMRRKIISMAIEMHWKKPGNDKDGMKRIDDWCEKFGQFKKPLNDHDKAELTKLVSQFENVYKAFMKKL